MKAAVQFTADLAEEHPVVTVVVGAVIGGYLITRVAARAWLIRDINARRMDK